MTFVQISSALRCDAYQAAPGCPLVSRPVPVEVGPRVLALLAADGWREAGGYPVRHLCPVCSERGAR